MSFDGTRKKRTVMGLVNGHGSGRSPAAKRVRQESFTDDPSPSRRRGRLTQTENSQIEDDSMVSSGSEPEDEDTVEECKIAGRVLSIELEDFMCHEHLFVKFDENRNCTYIGGPNGSGKSALFAALNLGLGGLGRTNDRGGSAASYIREGTTRARITIVLSNEGVGRHPKYSSQIVIKRTITSKANVYELKSRCAVSNKEELVSKKKADLVELCARFNIDLDNPVVWMSQDKSRQFLSEFEPKKLFSMFMEASKIGHCYQQCAEGRAELSDILEKLNQFKEVYEGLRAEYSKCKKRRDATLKIQAKKDELFQLECQLEWLPVKEKQEALASCEQELQNLEKKIDELKAKKQSLTENIAEQESEDSTADGEGISSRRLELCEALEAKRTENREIQEKYQDYKSKITRVVSLQNTAKRQLDTLNTQLRSMKGTDYEEQQEREQKLKAELEQIQKEEERLQLVREEYQGLLRNLRKEHEQRDEEVKRLRALLRNTKDRFDSIEMDKRRMEDIRIDRESRFGREIPMIKKILAQNKGRFDRPPIGPVGSYISVKDKKWVHVVESALRHQVCTYIVTSGRDRKTFYDLLHANNIRFKPTLICQRFRDTRLDIRRFEPSEEFLSVLRMITVTDDNVFNNLVEDCGAANIVLLNSDEEARRLMSSNPPRNVSKALSLNFGEAYPVTPDRPYRFYSNLPYTARYLTENDDASGGARNFPAEIQAVRNDIADATRNLTEAQFSLTEATRKLNDAQRESQRVDTTIENLADRREAIVPALQELRVEVDVEMLSNLEAEIKEKREKIEELKEAYSDLSEKLTMTEEQLRNMKASIQELEGRISGVSREQRELERRRQEQRDAVQDKKRKVTGYDHRIADYESKTSGKRKEAERLREKIATQESQLAESFAERNIEKPDLADLSPRDDLEDAARFLKDELRKYEELLGGPPVTTEQLEEKHAKIGDLKGKVDHYDTLVTTIRQLFLSRYKQLQHIVAYTTVKLQLSFVRQLNLRRYGGTLQVDFNKRTLDVHVQTHKHYEEASQKKSQDLRGLSGGERSYATACFVIALWECIECPFRLLDEFDVFMDMINRRIVMNSLVHVATDRFSTFQFFFFTPQGIQEIEEKEKVLIIKMPKVKR